MDTTRQAGRVGKRMWQQDVARILLGVVAVAGAVTLAVVAPNAIQALQLFSGEKKRHWSPSYVQGVVGRLQKRGFVRFERKSGMKLIRLTGKGEQELWRYRVKEKLAVKRRWDKKWRVIAFDIKERKKVLREGIRQELAALGFTRLQDSLWVFPYDCEEFIALLKADYHLGSEVLYLVVERIENDRFLKQHFNLI